jgi:hypothetical protein
MVPHLGTRRKRHVAKIAQPYGQRGRHASEIEWNWSYEARQASRSFTRAPERTTALR